jgi:hypothetical protein
MVNAPGTLCHSWHFEWGAALMLFCHLLFGDGCELHDDRLRTLGLISAGASISCILARGGAWHLCFRRHIHGWCDDGILIAPLLPSCPPFSTVVLFARLMVAGIRF